MQVLGRGLHPRLEEGAPELLNIRAEILHLHNMDIFIINLDIIELCCLVSVTVLSTFPAKFDVDC